MILLFETAVSEIIQRTSNVKSFRFPKPSSLSYKAGQFLLITIKAGDQKLEKHFSFSSSPTERDHIEFTKKLTGHEFSNALDVMKVGDWAEIDAPYGSFTFEGEYEKLLLLSGGIGITPLISICKYCTDKQLNTKITLLYGNRTEQDIAFRKELEEMQKKNRNIRVVFTLDEPGVGWTGLTGRIDAAVIMKEVPDYMGRVFYTCGPPGMIQVMDGMLEGLKIPQERIRTESFAGY